MKRTGRGSGRKRGWKMDPMQKSLLRLQALKALRQRAEEQKKARFKRPGVPEAKITFEDKEYVITSTGDLYYSGGERPIKVEDADLIERITRFNQQRRK